ncbi:transcription elongation factor GreA [Serinibacter salmoneus]|uniref:Transcription elongation factor GreA n=1 Tax=Serinibacter salmoneus TaxID=556530 RepID=A0A2A9D3A4_9MICO|nr:transcription elongation factor GreA [Serinibacter salmoneus]PFG20432.1 transcription elongation factor GreA [Serinibacter salmoneus]
MPETTWLTKDAYDRLKNELDYLSGPGRSEITARIEQARSEGDLKENGGYHAAREEQGKAEARIRQLQEILRNAEVGDAPPDDGVVEPGMVVTAVVGGEEMEFLFGSRESAQGVDIDVFSPSSALGAAINGKKAGDSTAYTTPRGAEIPVEIKAAKPFSA